MPRSAAAPRAAHVAPLALAVLLAAANADAQAVRGRVVQADAGAPASGAIVSLVDTAGRRIAPALVGADGAYVVHAPAAGAWRVRVDLIGYEAWTSDPLALAFGDSATLDVRLPLRRVELATVTVEGVSRCESRPDQAQRTVALWEEIRRALTISEISERRRLVPLDLTVTDERRMRSVATGGPVRRGGFYRDPHAAQPGSDLLVQERVLGRDVRRSRSAGARPWAPRPPAEVARDGFVRDLGGAYEYVGPDVPILLSREFLDGHCFRPVRRGRMFGADAIGLAFAPAPGRTVPDVEGTIWLDARSSELRRVEWAFVNLPDDLRRLGDAGGHLEFARQASGAWYVSRWEIERGGLLDARGGTFAHRTTGEAVPVGDVRGGRPPAALAGVVVDSTVGEGLADATVLVPGVAPARTDSLGRFAVSVPDLPDDSLDVVVAVEHPRFAVLGLASAEHTVRLRAGATSTLVVATPALPTLLAALCPLDGAAVADASGLPTLGMLVGRATTEDGAALPDGARVVAEWASDEGLGEGAATRTVRSAAPVGEDGRYRLCPLPVGRTLQLFVEVDGAEGGRTELVVSAYGIAQMDLRGGR